MRLRLRVQRNELPTVCTIWPVSEIQLKQTIAQLLSAINITFPLETGTWGLEDYAVLVGGFECLHYHELGAVVKDEDEVVIRPLQYSEVRARTLLGRAQISGDGRHLVDGVPFGRPLLRAAPVRPELRIPPRKRIKLANSGDDEGNVEWAYGSGPPLEERISRTDNDGKVFALPGFEQSEEEDEEEDSDFGLDDGDEDDEDVTSLSSSDGERDEDSESSSGSSTSSSDTDLDTDIDEESSSDDSSQSDSSSSSEGSWQGIDSSGPDTPVSNKSKGTDGTQSQPKDSVTESHTSTAVQKLNATPSGLPFKGKAETVRRNRRKRDAKKLAYLKSVGELPPNATLQDLKAWQDARELSNNPSSGDLEEDLMDTIAEQVPLEQSANPTELSIDFGAERSSSVGESLQVTNMRGGGSETSPSTLDHAEPPDFAPTLPAAQNETKDSSTEEFNLKRQKLLAAIAAGGVDVSETEEAPEEISSKRKHQDLKMQTDGSPHVADQAKEGASSMVPPSVVKRSKLDLAGSKRLLFGSLGVRVPKTQEEKEKLQSKLAERSGQQHASAPSSSERTDAVQASALTEIPVEIDDPDAWRTKIVLNAVECCDEGITLSTPPFPFFQRWDQSQRSSKRKKSASYGKNKRRKSAKNGGSTGVHIETYDKYNIDGYGDALDYDDVGEEEDELDCYDMGEEDEYWEEGALLGSDKDEVDDDENSPGDQLRKETAAVQPEDDFPALPEDLAQLPTIAESEAQSMDYIVFTQLACSAATHWQPKMLTQTVQLLDKDEDGWSIKFALRDLPQKQYDKDGNRVYEGFETEGLSDDGNEEDERVKTVQWSELIVPRLLLRPHREAVEAGDE